MTVPREAAELVEAVLRAARLSAREQSIVRAELECHFLDGLDAGVSLNELLASFGDPTVTATLISRAKRRRSGVVSRALGLTATAAAICYALAVFRLSSAPTPWSALRVDDEAASVLDRVSYAHSLLRDADGIRASFAVAAELRARHNIWAETASLPLLDETLCAAESLVSDDGRARLVDSLRALARRESLTVRPHIMGASIDQLVDRLHGESGRIDRLGLRLLQLAKGVERPTRWARLVEPVYFAPAASRDGVRRTVRQVFAGRIRLAEAAGRRLEARALGAENIGCL